MCWGTAELGSWEDQRLAHFCWKRGKKKPPGAQYGKFPPEAWGLWSDAMLVGGSVAVNPT
ncbi:hypothetical protein D3C84_1295700 [compost metagenome]